MPGARKKRGRYDREVAARVDTLSLRFVFTTDLHAGPIVQDLGHVRPAPTEIAVTLMGVDEAYRTLAVALRYPSHAPMLTSARNPDLKIGLEGAAEVVIAVRDLLVALPSLVASLFQPRESWRLAKLKNQVTAEEQRAKLAVARADEAEGDVRLLKAELEITRLQRKLAMVPIRPHGPSHRLLREIANETSRADPEKARATLGAAAVYIAQSHSYRPVSRIALVPALPVRGSAKAREEP